MSFYILLTVVRGRSGRSLKQVSGDPIASQNGVFYLLSDHLGSSSVTVKATDEGLTKVAELRYKP